MKQKKDIKSKETSVDHVLNSEKHSILQHIKYLNITQVILTTCDFIDLYWPVTIYMI